MAKKNKTSSLSSLWNDADPADATSLLPAGNHTVRLNSIKLQEKEGKGTSAVMEFEAIEGEFEGKKVSQYYQLVTKDGEPGQGVVYLKAAFGLLERGEIDGDDLETEFETITDEQPMVIIRVWDSGQYKNAAIVGLAEDDATGDDDDAASSDDDDEEVTAEIEVGSKVKWTEDDEEKEGTVKKIKGETATVIDEDGDSFKVDLDDLTLVTEEEAEDEDYDPEAGDDVTFTDPDDDDETLEGSVVKVKGDVVTVKVGKKEYKVDKDEVKKA